MSSGCARVKHCGADPQLRRRLLAVPSVKGTALCFPASTCSALVEREDRGHNLSKVMRIWGADRRARGTDDLLHPNPKHPRIRAKRRQNSRKDPRITHPNRFAESRRARDTNEPPKGSKRPRITAQSLQEDRQKPTAQSHQNGRKTNELVPRAAKTADEPTNYGPEPPAGAKKP